MSAMKAHVVNGQIILDEPVELPEGAVAEVRLLDDDEESPEERAEIEAAIDESLAEFEAGKIVDDETIRKMIRAYR
jgi:predicted transcriptional regulator